jgi:cytochrome c553
MRILTWLIRIVIALLVIVVIAAAAVFIGSQDALAKHVAISPVSQPVLTNPNVARGEHMVKSMVGCEDCHGANLGGKIFINSPALGTIYAPNITSGSGGFFATYNDVDFARAVRYGVAPDGRRLLIMPSDAFAELSDDDMADILAYVHSKPKVDGATPSAAVGPIGRVLILTGGLPFAADTIAKQNLAPSQPTIGVTADYGKYLARASGCISCHGVGLSGGHLTGAPSDPPAQNLTPSGDLAHWSFDQFKTAIRTGTRPDGTHMNPFMPWPSLSQMTDDELQAIWLYVKSVPPKKAGSG